MIACENGERLSSWGSVTLVLRTYSNQDGTTAETMASVGVKLYTSLIIRARGPNTISIADQVPTLLTAASPESNKYSSHEPVTSSSASQLSNLGQLTADAYVASDRATKPSSRLKNFFATAAYPASSWCASMVQALNASAKHKNPGDMNTAARTAAHGQVHV